MKKIAFVLFIVLSFAFLFGSCDKKPQNPNVILMDKDTSYSMGMFIAYQFMIPDVHYDYQALLEGFRAYNEMLETRFSLDEAYMKIQIAFERVSARDSQMSSADSERNREEGRSFLAENGRRPGVTTTSTGLQYEILVQGTGAKPVESDIIEVHYEGTFINGMVFDSSYMRGEPIVFPVLGVIEGWIEGLQLMNVGSTYMLYVPSDLAYGPYGYGSVPPNMTLIFKVELLSIIDYD